MTARHLQLLRRSPGELSQERPELDEAQRSVVDSTGSVAVIGGPGTGKTKTLIQSALARIEMGAEPSSLLILTYSRESASLLRDEIARGARSTASEALARTFHSLAFSILNEKLRPEDPSYVLISGAEQDAFIKELLLNDLVEIDWHSDLTEARKTRGFIREVRDLISRSTEFNLTPKALQLLGVELGEKYWDGGAKFWASYFKTMQLRNFTTTHTPIRIDPSSVIVEAIDRLKSDHVLLEHYRSRFSSILIDEFHESDRAQRELLELISSKELLLFMDQDSAVGRFRGADPDGLADWISRHTDRTIELSTVYRSSRAITDLGIEVASRFRSKNVARQRASKVAEKRSHSLPTPTTPLDPVEPVESVDWQARREGIDIGKFANPTEAANYIAYQFRRAHLEDGLPWSEMAILLRTPGEQVSAIQRACAINGIPLSIDSQAAALAENPAVRPILDIAQLIIKPELLTTSHWPKIEELLLSEFGGADAIQLRQIRIALSKARSDGDLRSTTSMMLDAMSDPIAEISDDQIIPLVRIRTLLQAGRKVKGDISELLWAIWSNSKNYQGQAIPDLWRERALAGGSRGAAADRDLDSVIQLFESARRFSERTVQASPQLFIDQLMGERILSDAISSRAQRENVVTLTTVHSAKGREWELVAIAGLQEGSWPNLAERGSLLGSERLVEAVRTGLTIRDQIAASAHSALIEDERRLLHVSLTRAKARLIITAAQEEDSYPSRYFEEIYEYLHGNSAEEAELISPERALTQQALVASLRRDLMDPDNDQPTRDFASALLQTLARAGVRSADPSAWLGVRALSVDKPLIADEREIYLSPSSLQNFVDCGLKWFLEKSGAKDGDSAAQLLGVAIHALAALVIKEPELSAERAIETLTRAWGVVDQNVGWYKSAQLESASEMLRRFFTWNSANDRVLLAAEKNFFIKVGRAVIKGQVDRLEMSSDGSTLHIVDLKTGKSIATKAETDEHRQLKAYQLAVLMDGFNLVGQERITEVTASGGAELLFLAKDTKSVKSQEQMPINQEEVVADISTIAEGMAAATFTARANKRCSTCAVAALCPLQSAGRSVIE
jgi:superfamily I DNA/RNA helicase/RecB family exonuclease